ncbi:MAG: 30S ribosome-binding factor RbfA [Chloroflexi bacterium]|nr:MAG: ribosome-binding factor A [Anaerolineaceae bacterium 4572_32.2]RLC78997.1 MAG: 30S ribosome-binding factor RbfA [Chloroflexota bacterium]RLC86120.1 MAG: 30S ribosome-binding factor RbfA [Chloroflexota bacterium]HEY72862.1 30S ribosome-binding factor RbfA [Thermoflexia bacterium]
MSKKYQRRVSDLIRTHLTNLLARKVSDPRLRMVTITGVAVTPDTVRADVHFSVLGGAEGQAEAQAGLDSAAGWLRRELGRRLRLRNTPELVFHYDPSLEHGDRIDSILKELEFGEENHGAETG